MTRLKIELPSIFHFSTNINIRITDLNYGGHVGNDTILSLIHEARMQFLNTSGYTEMNCGGIGLIMRDAAVEFKKELFYGDVIKISVATIITSKMSFEFLYKIEKQEGEKNVVAAKVKTTMIGYNYSSKKIADFPEEVISKFTALKVD